MGFWSFMRDMMVLDWLFGHQKKKSFWEQSKREVQRYADHYRQNDYYCGYHGDYKIDYVQQDFDDDLDKDIFDDDI